MRMYFFILFAAVCCCAFCEPAVAETIEINSDITTNQIWTASNEYYITANVNVQALLVIEPGTLIYFGNNGGLIVNNGGTLISAGTPDNFIVYTSEAGYGWNDYECAIEVQETASPATKIIYNYIENGWTGISTSNIRLDTPIQNNFLFYNDTGILEYGTHHTDILNNLIYYCYNDDYYSFGIFIYMESESGTADSNSKILIENNTCDYQDYGIVVSGTDEQNDGGLAILYNNIVSSSGGYGLALVNGYFADRVSNMGYYNNYYNNIGVYDEDEPVETFDNPYDSAGWHLVDGCPFIDAGLEYIEETSLIGTTTNVNSMPDSNIIDIGFHYANWDYSNAGTTSLRADFDNSLNVDYNDLAYFLGYWLYDYNEDYQIWWWDYVEDDRIDFADLAYLLEYWPDYFNFVDFADFAEQWQKQIDARYYNDKPDLNGDEVVNFMDFAILANEWRQTAEGNPAISVSVDGDVNNLSGEVGISVSGCVYSTLTAYIYMDGLLLDEIDYDESTPGITINTPAYLNGSHSFKAVVIDHNGLITASDNLYTDFNNPVHCLTVNDTYEPNQPLNLSGFSVTDSNLQVKLSKWDGTTIWSQEISDANIDVNIPGSVLEGEIYDISIEQELSQLESLDLQLDGNSENLNLLSSDAPNWERCWEGAITAKYLPTKQYTTIIILPKASATDWENTQDCRKNAVSGIINLCHEMHMNFHVFYGKQCTWENFVQAFTGQTAQHILNVYLVSAGSNYPIEGDLQRTWFRLSDSYVISNLNTPVNGRWDHRAKVHSLAALNLPYYVPHLKLVWADVCFNGKYTDMANAWFGGSGEYFGSNKLYVSWSQAIQYDPSMCPAKWTAFFFGYPNPDKGFGIGGFITYEQAFDEAQRNNNVDCAGNNLVNNSFLGTLGDRSVRFTGKQYP